MFEEGEGPATGGLEYSRRVNVGLHQTEGKSRTHEAPFEEEKVRKTWIKV